MSEILSDHRVQRIVCSLVRTGRRLPLMTSSVSGQCLFCGDTLRDADPCVSSWVRHTVACWTLQWKLPAERETLCVHHANEQFIETRRKLESFEIHSRSAQSDCRWLYVRVQVRRDGAFGRSRVAIRDDSATAPDEGHVHVQRTPGQQMPASLRRASVDKPTPNQRQAGCCSVRSSS